ncbi:DNA topoisomerase [Streptomyces turgidiscabies]|uniref:Type I DNA topoisomerase n=1 Tax=Streptomyces turgidiscabies (strain Car8) TaxID=698760 RepID=L7F405_STRT8|nr:DNA topoisomerase [Streptomyces turgidiscabies]ELP66328.1 type I DNA topoisomerase [Streptomyces turgidiscabies Car8]MDX3499742.1 DNA topoisomerase [Streptomyces turgidiscabies]GAQ76000.1 DNA topoisomerase 3 [Streptomyces turgidiscabies]
MVAIVVAEKPSAARNMASALGGTKGSYKGTAYEVASLRGHLYEFAQPHAMVDSSLADAYLKWDLSNLPWDPDDLTWKREPQKNVADVIKTLRSALSRGDEIVIATDLDPSGEGDLLFWEAIDELGFHGKRFSRMEFTDESKASIQKAFEQRRPVKSMQNEGDYRKAMYRSQWDFLSMQFTRIATAMGRQSGQDLVLRQGRLKSAMVSLVGDQQKAYDAYVKKPFFQNRFRDENDVMYTNPDEPRFDQKGQVPQQYGPSPVVLDSKAGKKTAPPKLLDLASLSSMLVGKGVKANLTLSTYQKMYEDQVVSYPRTEDKTITPEQFKDLAPLIDKIAAVVGVDAGLLTHRQPRSTHVKPEGAHGANRPGPKVPFSLDEVEHKYGKAGRLIYEMLAKNYLAMLAEDYLYEQQKGHVEKYPDFVGIANVPKSPGWRAVFDPDAGDDTAEGDENESGKGLGQTAEPFIFEGANKRPEHPTMKWLMKQLEKRDVGTGATRTSTYSEVTNGKAKYPLLTEKGRKLRLAQAGEMSWRLLPGTRIGDLGLTEKVYADMRDIAAGTATAEERLAVVADWVREDIATMTKNATSMRAELGLKKQVVAARAEGVWQAAPGGPKKVALKKIWSGHEFSDDEVAKLLAGETISFEATNKAGKPYTATGALGVGDFKGRKFVGFQLEVPDKPTKWSGRTFTPAEVTALLAGQALEIDDFVSARTGKTFGCKVSWDAKAKKIVPDFGSGDEPPRSWCQVTFTDAQRKDLAAGKTIQGTGFVSSKGKTFDAKVAWKEEGGKKKIVPLFG